MDHVSVQKLNDGYDSINVVDGEFKSAILKGNTLVNLVDDVTSNEVGRYSDSPCKINIIRNLQNETLTIIFNAISLEIPDGADGTLRIGGGWSGQIRYQPTLGVNKVLYNYNQTSNNWLGAFSNTEAYNLGQRITISDVMVLEGDYTNVDIPYFEGMTSVKMPVLTTVGKNLFDGEFDLTIGTTHAWSKNFIKVMPNTAYIFSHHGTEPTRKVDATNYYNEKFELIGEQGIKNSVTTPNDCHYIKFRYHLMDQDLSKVENTQLEQGTVATPYEPYKSNILTVNEEVELRGIGDVQGELNC
jgi:hypothetical protein